MKYQVMPDLTPLEYEALKADIANAGAVLVAIELDEDGAILDGHHRVRAWEELRQEGYDLPGYPRVVRRGMTEQQKRAHAYRLNTHRRHLTREQRDEVMRQMRADGATYQEIASAVGVSTDTAHRVARNVELSDFGKVTGADGKQYPASYNRQPDDEHTFQSSIPIQPLIGADWAGEEETDRTVYYTVRTNDGIDETLAVAPDEELAVIKRPHVANNSGNNEWYTPAEYLDAARQVMGHIDLDPASCALANQTVGALRYFSAMDDGLEQHWAGNVWMNPPYAAGLIDRFCAKYCTHVQYGEIKQGIVLVNNATETKWFGLLVAAGSAVVFPQGRVRFWSPDGTESQPLQGQAIIYSGPNVERFLQVFGLLVGRTIEQAVKDAIKERYSVVMTGSIAGAGQHGPRMEDAGAGVVLADMQLYRGPRAGWVEVKSKTDSNYYRNFGIEEHGIDRSKAVEYWRLQKQTGQPVYLLICEYRTGDVLMQNFDTLMQPKFFRKGKDSNTGKLMINWDRGMFAKVGEFVIPADDLRRLVVTIDWAQFETFCTQPILIEEE